MFVTQSRNRIVAVLLGLCCIAPLCVAQPAAQTDESPHAVRLIDTATDVQIEVLDWGGEGETIMLLPGDGNTAHVYDDFAPKLAENFHVLAVTRRGNGASSQPLEDYSVATRVADLWAVAEELNIPRFHLIGHSVAGDELVRFAATHPDRVQSLIFLDAAYDRADLGQLAATAGQYFVPPPRPAETDEASLSAMRDYLARVEVVLPEAEIHASRTFSADGKLVGRVTSAATAQAIARSVEHPDYAGIEAPALAIYAVPDPGEPESFFTYYPLLNQDDQQRLRTFIERTSEGLANERTRFKSEVRNSKTIELAGAHHYVFISNEAVVLREIRAFIGE